MVCCRFQSTLVCLCLPKDALKVYLTVLGGTSGPIYTFTLTSRGVLGLHQKHDVGPGLVIHGNRVLIFILRVTKLLFKFLLYGFNRGLLYLGLLSGSISIFLERLCITFMSQILWDFLPLLYLVLLLII